MSTHEKIIFLDIDGPVVPWKNHIAYEGSGRLAPHDPTAVHFISKIAEHADAKIVIAAQKRNEGYDKFLEQFIEYGFAPELLHKDWATGNFSNRLEDLHNWLTNHPEITHWIAIDDEALDTDHLVMVCPANGFLLSNYDEALKGLGMKAPAMANMFYWKARVGFEGPKEIRDKPETQNTIARLHILDRFP